MVFGSMELDKVQGRANKEEMRAQLQHQDLQYLGIK
jgi:hypothetical protein